MSRDVRVGLAVFSIIGVLIILACFLILSGRGLLMA